MNEVKSGCSKHRKDVAGISSMMELAGLVGDLHYQTLSEFLLHLAAKIANDAEKDEQGGKNKLAHELSLCSKHLFSAEQRALNAWLICKPFMEKQKPIL